MVSLIRHLFALAFAVAVAYAVLVVFAWAAQRQFVYLPHDDLLTPATFGVESVEQVRIPTDDGLELGGWLLSATAAARATVVVFNGNAGNRSHRLPLATAFTAHGYDVLLFDYRGFGGNAGRPNETGLTTDALAVARFLAGRADVDPARVVYFGESLGAAVAIRLALDQVPAALVLRSPFTSVVDVARHHFPFLPVGWFLHDRFPSIDRIARVQAPVMVVAGGHDRIVPVEQSERLHAAVRSPKTWLVLPDADHNDAVLGWGAEVIAAATRFIDAHVEVGGAASTGP